MGPLHTEFSSAKEYAIYFYMHFTALCFTAQADDSLILVLPFARPFIFMIYFFS